MYNTTYFKDDHNRILRVVINTKTEKAEVHLLQVFKTGKKFWVPLPEANEVALSQCSLERLAYEDLLKKAKNCPLFEQI